MRGEKILRKIYIQCKWSNKLTKKEDISKDHINGQPTTVLYGIVEVICYCDCGFCCYYAIVSPRKLKIMHTTINFKIILLTVVYYYDGV